MREARGGVVAGLRNGLRLKGDMRRCGLRNGLRFEETRGVDDNVKKWLKV